MDEERSTCHDCDVREGEIHEYGCDMERCPFCGGQQISCDCMYNHLGLRNDHTVEDEDRWLEKLEEKGRVPFIVYPNMCVRCGELWPKMFKTTDEEWNKYVELRVRGEMICRKCYDWIKLVIDEAKERRRQEDQ